MHLTAILVIFTIIFLYQVIKTGKKIKTSKPLYRKHTTLHRDAVHRFLLSLAITVVVVVYRIQENGLSTDQEWQHYSHYTSVGIFVCGLIGAYRWNGLRSKQYHRKIAWTTIVAFGLTLLTAFLLVSLM